MHFKFEELVKIKEEIDNIEKYEDIGNLIKLMPFYLIGKLQLLPSSNLRSILEHFRAIVEFSLDNYENIVGIEGFVNDIYVIDFDVLIEDKPGFFRCIDLTANRALFEAKLTKMRGIAKDLQNNLHNYLGRDVHAVEPDVFVFYPNRSDPVVLREFKSELFNQSYNITESITKDNIEIIRPKAKRFLTNVDNAIKDMKLQHTIDPDEDQSLNEFSTDWSNMAKENSVEILKTFENVASKVTGFPNKCLEYCKKLNSFVFDHSTRKWLFKYRACSVTKIENKIIPNNFLSNPILKALSVVVELADKTKFIGVREDGSYSVIHDLVGPFCEEEFVLTAKFITDTDFIIYFNEDFIDSNLSSAIRRKHTNGQKATKPENSSYFLKDKEQTDNIHYAEDLIRDQEAEFKTINSPKASNSVFDKISFINNDSVSRGTNNTDIRVGSLFNSFINLEELNFIKNILEHEFEIAKGFSTTLARPPKNDQYKLVFNSAFSSITLKQNNSTLDSFKNAFYIVFYQSLSTNSSKLYKEPFVKHGDIFQNEAISFNRNTLSWELRKAYNVILTATWMIENRNLVKDKKVDSDLILNSYFKAYCICNTNRDAFAQVSEQVRYLYVTTTGKFSKPSAILDKFDDYHPRNIYEIMYVIRELKMASALYSLKATKLLHAISGNDYHGNSVLQVAFPHDKDYVLDFNYSISSFYICNIFNKYKYNTTISEANCYEGLLKEDKIFKKSISERPNNVVGLSQEVYDRGVTDFNLILDQYSDYEFSYITDLMRSDASRYSFSLVYILCVMIKEEELLPNLRNEVLTRLDNSVIDMCSNHGSMTGDVPTKDRQSVRVASAILEGVLKDYDVSVDRFNTSELYKQFVSDTLSCRSVSVLTLIIFQYAASIVYALRIVHKDQKGDREISVLNYMMRIGAKLVEEISRALSRYYPINILENPNKNMLFQNIITKSKEKQLTIPQSLVVYDNADQKRWGPNHLVITFFAMIHVLTIKEDGISPLVKMVLTNFEKKLVKYPEGIIDMIAEGTEFNEGRTLGSFIKNIKFNVGTGKYCEKMEWGMCQGILHVTSSIYHAVMNKHIEELMLKENIILDITTVVTSDDVGRCMLISKIGDLNEKLNKILTYINSVSNCFNIIRSLNKSSLSTILAEFNSEFYIAGRLYAPSLKQRISKFDCGFGNDYIEDILTACGNSNSYFMSGGSYLSSYILQTLNIAFTCDQWRKFFRYSKRKTDTSVVLGSNPISSPMAVATCGPIAAIIYTDLCKDVLNIEEITDFVAKLTYSKPEFVTQEEFIRGSSTVSKDFKHKFLQDVSFSGLLPLSRPSKKETNFTKRHKLRDILLRGENLSLNEYCPSFENLLLNLITGVGSKSSDVELGTNTIIQRFSEPYVNIDAKKFKVISDKSIAKIYGSEGDKLSLRDIEEIQSESDTLKRFKNIAKDIYLNRDTNQVKLAELLQTNFINLESLSARCSSASFIAYSERRNYGFQVSKLAVNSISVIDDEVFRLSIFKSLSGESGVKTLLKSGFSANTIEDIPKQDLQEAENIIDAYMLSEKAVQVFGRFLRTKTKGILKIKPNTTDLYAAVLSGSYINFTSRISVRPPRLKEIASGQKIKITTLKVTKDLEEANDQSLNEVTPDIFQFCSANRPKIYLDYKQEEHRESFEIVTDALNVTRFPTDTYLDIHSGSSNKIRKRLDSVMNTSNGIRFRSTALINFEPEKFSLSGYLKFNEHFIKRQSINKVPLHFDMGKIISYNILYNEGTYTHCFLLKDETEASTRKFSCRITKFEDFEAHDLGGYQVELFNRMADRRDFPIESITKVSESDSVQISFLNRLTICKFEKSASSFLVSLNIDNFLLPYAIEKVGSIDRIKPRDTTEYKPADIRRCKGLSGCVLDCLLENVNKEEDVVKYFKAIQIPNEDGNRAHITTLLFNLNINEDNTDEELILSAVANPHLFTFFLANSLPEHLPSIAMNKINFYKNNLTKPPHVQLCMLSLDREPLKPLERIKLPSISAEADFDFDQFETDLMEALEGEEKEETEVEEDIQTEVMTDFATMFGVELEDVVDNEEEEELIDTKPNFATYSVHHNYTDKKVSLLIDEFLHQITAKLTPIYPSLNRSDLILRTINKLDSQSRVLPNLINIMNSYMDLDRFALMLLGRSV